MSDIENGRESPKEYWRGSTMEAVYRYLDAFELTHAPPVFPSENHTVLYLHPIPVPDNVPPLPFKSEPKWDAFHVRLPCSDKSKYPVATADGNSTIQPRWEMIQKAILKPIHNSHELQAVILSYNTKYSDKWVFHALHRLFESELDESETKVFFEDLLPRIARLALCLPDLIKTPIPLLKQGKTHAISLTQQQVACLLANAFFCTFPRRNTMKRKSEYGSFPDINFNRFFQARSQSVLEKLKCLFHYFRRVCPTTGSVANVPTGVVTFKRQRLSNLELPNWSECEAPLDQTVLHISSAGTIEDQGLGLLQVDFANKFIGGGILGRGCVQEEIRFIICPELIVAKLFTECLLPTESLLMIGCERYSNYTGYADSFQWAGNHVDPTPLDISRRRQTHIVGIDALSFRRPVDQYREDLMIRELNKAYVGFSHSLHTPPPGVASGNWGCGAFRGDPMLKALLQLMVCAIVQRPLVYYTFGNETLRDEVFKMHNFFKEKSVRVKDLWNALTKFESQQLAPTELYNFIYSCINKSPQHRPNIKSAFRKNSIRSNNATPNVKIFSNILSTAVPSKAVSHLKSISEDLLHSSSVKSEPKVQAKEHQKPVDSIISESNEESKIDELLMSVANEVEAAEDVSSEDKLNSPPPKKVSRQRTLLEMLDETYTKSGKRICQRKT